MATGFCPYLLDHISQVAKTSTPEMKVTPTGFLGMLKTMNSPDAIKVDKLNGHKAEFRVKYKKRWRKADTDTTASCDNVLVPAYVEDTMTLTKYRQLAIQIDDDQIEQYCEDASRSKAAGTPATDFMNEFYNSTILQGAMALLTGVNDDLVDIQTGRFGVNVRTGNALTSTLNINKDQTVNPLDDGIVLMLSDYKRNEMMGRPIVVGAGLMLNYVLQQPFKTADQSGLDSRMALGQYDFFYDEAATSWGVNQIGVFEKDSVQIVEYMMNRGFKAGDKGVSKFGIIPIPMATEKGTVPILFDYQFKYHDCPTNLTNAYDGSVVTVDRGYVLIISKRYDLWNIPSDAYQNGDRLSGARGSLRYTVSNECESCS
jgi:hypothetical protein